MSKANVEAVETPVVAAKAGNVVVMKDGRSVDFGVRGKLKKSIVITGEGDARVAQISIDCINGDTHATEVNLNHTLLLELAAHGLSQKVTDSVTKAEDGDDISFGVSNQIDQISKGIWSQRSTGEVVARGFADLYEAIRRIKGYDVGSPEAAGLKVSLAAKPEAEIKNFKNNPQIKSVIAQIVSEKAVARAAKLGVEAGTTELDLTGL
jgi:hypothetical protein